MSKQIVIISGPTGSGESTLTKALIERFPGKITRMVTATTRPPRDNEKDGVDYFFFSKEEFKKLEAEGVIPESGYIANRDTYYGTYVPDLQDKLAKGMVVVGNLQIQGTLFHKEHNNATTIFIDTESIEALMRRIRARSPGLSEEEFALREADAAREIQEERPLYDYFVLNADGKLNEAVDRIVEILKKEGYNLE